MVGCGLRLFQETLPRAASMIRWRTLGGGEAAGAPVKLTLNTSPIDASARALAAFLISPPDTGGNGQSTVN
jgi:hypothetical protein